MAIKSSSTVLPDGQVFVDQQLLVDCVFLLDVSSCELNQRHKLPEAQYTLNIRTYKTVLVFGFECYESLKIR